MKKVVKNLDGDWPLTIAQASIKGGRKKNNGQVWKKFGKGYELSKLSY